MDIDKPLEIDEIRNLGSEIVDRAGFTAFGEAGSGKVKYNESGVNLNYVKVNDRFLQKIRTETNKINDIPFSVSLFVLSISTSIVIQDIYDNAPGFRDLLSWRFFIAFVVLVISFHRVIVLYNKKNSIITNIKASLEDIDAERS
jgi:hypothetical protein